ncbi:hypothetical protein F7Q99_28285 [Streptomyces kaniharaensis]|uniref:Helicase-associated domain-containing protein n=1 Tax=Streptomyces kaniharaensis TaxID=212423 RepID=A0A6N7KYZ3_9ACTN|nr:helicase associated domain-containing protein [Streptomyces kaniharaensis]MQS16035.1 hypothetical protein [Streptomyces kaniharaensis]
MRVSGIPKILITVIAWRRRRGPPSAATRSGRGSRSCAPRASSQLPGALVPERRRALEEIDLFWCPAWPITWQRAYTTARQWWLESDGLVDWTTLPQDPVYEGEQLGRWVKAQRAAWPDLAEDQQDLLAAIGIGADAKLVAAKAAAEAKPAVSRADRFAQGLAALAQFVERERHPRVPRPHKEPVEAVEAGDGGEGAKYWLQVLTEIKNRGVEARPRS